MFPVTIFYKVPPQILSLLKIDNAISKRSRVVQAQLAPRGPLMKKRVNGKKEIPRRFALSV